MNPSIKTPKSAFANQETERKETLQSSFVHLIHVVVFWSFEMLESQENRNSHMKMHVLGC